MDADQQDRDVIDCWAEAEGVDLENEAGVAPSYLLDRSTSPQILDEETLDALADEAGEVSTQRVHIMAQAPHAPEPCGSAPGWPPTKSHRSRWR